MIIIFFMRVQEISGNQNIDASDFFSYTGQKQKKIISVHVPTSKEITSGIWVVK